jgi:ribosomal protein L21E
MQKEEYQPGDLVLIRNSRLEMTVTKFKTDPRYLGPYEVVMMTKGGSYILKELDGTLHKQHYAASRLIQYIHRNDPKIYELAKRYPTGDEEDQSEDSDIPDDLIHEFDTDVKMADP